MSSLSALTSNCNIHNFTWNFHFNILFSRSDILNFLLFSFSCIQFLVHFRFIRKPFFIRRYNPVRSSLTFSLHQQIFIYILHILFLFYSCRLCGQASRRHPHSSWHGCGCTKCSLIACHFPLLPAKCSGNTGRKLCWRCSGEAQKCFYCQCARGLRGGRYCGTSSLCQLFSLPQKLNGKDNYFARLLQEWHNSKCIIFQEELLKV